MHAQKTHNLVGPNRRKPSSDLRIHSTIVLCFATAQTRVDSRDEQISMEVKWLGGTLIT